MRVSYSLGSLLSIGEVLGCSKILDSARPDTVWIPETWGMENFAMLSAVSQVVGCKVGSSITNIYSRSPALAAMGAVTVDALSGGRMVMGLGAGSPPIVGGLHGMSFERPVERMREYVEVVRLASSGNRIDYSGEFFKLKGFTLIVKPVREQIPVYMAAVNRRMLELAWEIADGALLFLRPLGELRGTIKRMQSRRKIDAACQVITAVSHDSEAAAARARTTVAFYVSVGSIYREFLAASGFDAEVGNIYGEYKKSGIEAAAGQVTPRMVSELAVCGTPDECRKGIERFAAAGIDLPIIQLNPVGDALESCRLIASAMEGA
ncbi:flavin-dependent oxidoreductase [Cenarchaeum symbiosum A]|uniref:Flavin-dependent oxidoreductase n=1 Tax=Cenarchaeum symbiosum (strain A) TaxID=414004 RepID=A0RV54_CENSY|nr:flavin-dependent oxidoreductase [Cenarchaeum symbiosum A]